MKILFLTRFGQQGASSRVRLLQFLPWFDSAASEYEIFPLFDDAMLLRKYKHGGYGLRALSEAYWRRIHVLNGRRQFDLVWIEKEALPWFPALFERLLLRRVPYCLDFDDAIFHNYDMHRSALVRAVYGKRIDSMMACASLVVAGNRYLADRAITAGAKRVEVMPTVVDLARYMPKKVYSVDTKLRIVWIGSPSTVQYLRELEAPLGELAKHCPFTLRVVGGGELSLPGVDVESLSWSEDTEAASIYECDIGIMPLRDTPWERGKCAYKLIQYMACGLPTVSSPVGANMEVVIDGETGLFADSPVIWVERLKNLLCDAALRQRFGQAGRARVEAKYSLQQAGPKLAHLLTQAGMQ